MDPAYIAIMGTIIMTVLLRLYGYKIESSDKPRVHPLEKPEAPKELTVSANDATMCSLYEVRLTQQKMVDAGIIRQSELSQCENKDCKNCYPDASLVPAPLLIPARPRTRTVNGQTITIPDDVPDFASVNYEAPTGLNHWYALWRWTDPESGRYMGARSAHMHDEYFKASFREKIAKTKELVEASNLRNECDCSEFEIHTDQYLDAINITRDYVCEKHKQEALSEALKRTTVRKRTGSLGPM